MTKISETVLKTPPRKEKPQSELAKTIVHYFSLRAKHYRQCAALGIDLSVVMPDNTNGVRVKLFAHHVLGQPTITADGLNQKFGEQARTVAVLMNDFIADSSEKIELNGLLKLAEKKSKEEELEEEFEIEEELAIMFEDDNE
jgi:hypothetical protein